MRSGTQPGFVHPSVRIPRPDFLSRARQERLAKPNRRTEIRAGFQLGPISTTIALRCSCPHGLTGNHTACFRTVASAGHLVQPFRFGDGVCKAFGCNVRMSRRAPNNTAWEPVNHEPITNDWVLVPSVRAAEKKHGGTDGHGNECNLCLCALGASVPWVPLCPGCFFASNVLTKKWFCEAFEADRDFTWTPSSVHSGFNSFPGSA